jgi:hypothetical protein
MQMRFKRALYYRKEFLIERPDLQEQVDDLLQLMYDEIIEGGSPENEMDIFISSCDDLLKEEL